MPPQPSPPLERFWPKVDVTPGCWIWTAAKHSTGYGKFYFNGRLDLAHRAAYQMLVGPIPEGLEIDHLCRNRACVNPAHMEPVTRRENGARGFGPQGLNVRKTHCKRGHEFTPENTYRDPVRGNRSCRRCHAEREARRRTAC